MGEPTEIAWTDHTFNPWWGCTKISPGCEHCYAEVWAKRVGLGWGSQSARRLFGDAHWSAPLKWAAKARKDGVRRRVFCASMCDVFQVAEELDAPRARLAALIRDTSDALDWLLLTKRPESFRLLSPDVLALCWLGVTVENQRSADERIPMLLETPARVRFLSCEPLLEVVELWGAEPAARCEVIDALRGTRYHPGGVDRCNRVDWVIVGCESGTRRRPCDNAWVRDIVRQCREAGVPAFVKQLQVGPRRIVVTDQALFPEDLRVREMPEMQS